MSYRSTRLCIPKSYKSAACEGLQLLLLSRLWGRECLPPRNLLLFSDKFLKSGSNYVWKFLWQSWTCESSIFTDLFVRRSCVMADGWLDHNRHFSVHPWKFSLIYALCCQSWHWGCTLHLFVDEYPSILSFFETFLLSKN